MAENTQGASASVTASLPFLFCNPERTALLCVNPDVPAGDALEMASTFLSAACSAVYKAAADCDVDHAEHVFAAGYLVEISKAVVNAVISGADREERREHNLLQRLHLLCKEGVLIINPQADKPAADDAGHFVGWVAEQVKGGAA